MFLTLCSCGQVLTVLFIARRDELGFGPNLQEVNPEGLPELSGQFFEVAIIVRWALYSFVYLFKPPDRVKHKKEIYVLGVP